jgi:RNA polymerase sigma factor (sigma-70 family)
MSGTGTDEQLADLVRRFSRIVRAAAARVGGVRGRQLADDVEQQVFVSLWKQVSREQIIVNPASYIYRCAVRETIRLLNREHPADALDEAAELVAGADPAPDERLEVRERSRAMADALRHLAVDRRRAVQAHLAGFSVAETMAMYGWSYQRTRNLVARGMADLRARLKERGVDG